MLRARAFFRRAILHGQTHSRPGAATSAVSPLSSQGGATQGRPRPPRHRLNGSVDSCVDGCLNDSVLLSARRCLGENKTTTTQINPSPDELRAIIREELDRTAGRPPAIANAEQAAKYLGWSLNTLRAKWREWGLRKAYPDATVLPFRYTELDRWIEAQGEKEA